MDRKEFLKTCGVACLSGATLITFLESCSSANYFAKTSTEGNRIAIKKSEFISVEKDKTTARKYVLVKTEKLNFPICLYKLSELEYSALLMECTHKGCELQPQGEYMICPCHGSEFSNKGVVQNPPAEQNLQSFKTITDNENIYIQL
ncbi:MAG: Rieske 2Fe-2S domain-containing protein [Bacteroidota bacterium]